MSRNAYISVPAVVLFVGAGILGFVLCLLMTDAAGNVLGWITVSQACAVLIVWPNLHRDLNHTVSPLVLIFLSAPLYAAGIKLGGTGGGETIMTLVLVCMMFLYVSFLFRLEKVRGVPPGSWYIPLSTILVAGPVLVYYVLTEFLRYQLPWIIGISPVAALGARAHLSTGCAAWVGVIVVTAAAGLLSERALREKNEDT